MHIIITDIEIILNNNYLGHRNTKLAWILILLDVSMYLNLSVLLWIHNICVCVCVIVVFLYTLYAYMHLAHRKVVSIDVYLSTLLSLTLSLSFYVYLSLSPVLLANINVHTTPASNKRLHTPIIRSAKSLLKAMARVCRHNGRDNCFRRLEHSRPPRI